MNNAAIGEPPPYWGYRNQGYVPPFYQNPVPAPCDHCLCMVPTEFEMLSRTVPHMKCCHCSQLYVPLQEGHELPEESTTP